MNRAVLLPKRRQASRPPSSSRFRGWSRFRRQCPPVHRRRLRRHHRHVVRLHGRHAGPCRRAPGRRLRAHLGLPVERHQLRQLLRPHVRAPLPLRHGRRLGHHVEPGRLRGRLPDPGSHPGQSTPSPWASRRPTRVQPSRWSGPVRGSTRSSRATRPRPCSTRASTCSPCTRTPRPSARRPRQLVPGGSRTTRT